MSQDSRLHGLVGVEVDLGGVSGVKGWTVLAQAVEAACSGEPQLWATVEAAAAFETELMDVTRLHLGF